MCSLFFFCRVFLSGRENFDTLHNNPASSIRAEWDDWCRLLHERAGWEYRFWDLEVRLLRCIGATLA